MCCPKKKLKSRLERESSRHQIEWWLIGAVDRHLASPRHDMSLQVSWCSKLTWTCTNDIKGQWGRWRAALNCRPPCFCYSDTAPRNGSMHCAIYPWFHTKKKISSFIVPSELHHKKVSHFSKCLRLHLIDWNIANVELLESSYHIKHFPFSNRLPIIWTCHTITFRNSSPSEYML